MFWLSAKKKNQIEDEFRELESKFYSTRFERNKLYRRWNGKYMSDEDRVLVDKKNEECRVLCDEIRIFVKSRPYTFSRSMSVERIKAALNRWD